MKINDGFKCRARDVEGGSEASPFNMPQCASKRSGGVNAGTKCGRSRKQKSYTDTQREGGLDSLYQLPNVLGKQNSKKECRCLALSCRNLRR